MQTSISLLSYRLYHHIVSPIVHILTITHMKKEIPKLTIYNATINPNTMTKRVTNLSNHGTELPSLLPIILHQPWKIKYF